MSRSTSRGSAFAAWTVGSRTEADFIRRLDELGLPVIVVLTQVPMRDNHYHPDAIALAEQIMARRLPIAGGRPFLTYAMADEFSGQPAYGLRICLMPPFALRPKESTEPSSRRSRLITFGRSRKRGGS